MASSSVEPAFIKKGKCDSRPFIAQSACDDKIPQSHQLADSSNVKHGSSNTPHRLSALLFECQKVATETRTKPRQDTVNSRLESPENKQLPIEDTVSRLTQEGSIPDTDVSRERDVMMDSNLGIVKKQQSIESNKPESSPGLILRAYFAKLGVHSETGKGLVECLYRKGWKRSSIAKHFKKCAMQHPEIQGKIQIVIRRDFRKQGVAANTTNRSSVESGRQPSKTHRSGQSTAFAEGPTLNIEGHRETLCQDPAATPATLDTEDHASSMPADGLIEAFPPIPTAHERSLRGGGPTSVLRKRQGSWQPELLRRGRRRNDRNSQSGSFSANGNASGLLSTRARQDAQGKLPTSDSCKRSEGSAHACVARYSPLVNYDTPAAATILQPPWASDGVNSHPATKGNLARGEVPWASSGATLRSGAGALTRVSESSHILHPTYGARSVQAAASHKASKSSRPGDRLHDGPEGPSQMLPSEPRRMVAGGGSDHATTTEAASTASTQQPKDRAGDCGPPVNAGASPRLMWGNGLYSNAKPKQPKSQEQTNDNQFQEEIRRIQACGSGVQCSSTFTSSQNWTFEGNNSMQQVQLLHLVSPQSSLTDLQDLADGVVSEILQPTKKTDEAKGRRLSWKELATPSPSSNTDLALQEVKKRNMLELSEVQNKFYASLKLLKDSTNREQDQAVQNAIGEVLINMDLELRNSEQVLLENLDNKIRDLQSAYDVAVSATETAQKAQYRNTTPSFEVQSTAAMSAADNSNGLDRIVQPDALWDAARNAGLHARANAQSVVSSSKADREKISKEANTMASRYIQEAERKAHLAAKRTVKSVEMAATQALRDMKVKAEVLKSRCIIYSSNVSGKRELLEVAPDLSLDVLPAAIMSEMTATNDVQNMLEWVTMVGQEAVRRWLKIMQGMAEEAVSKLVVVARKVVVELSAEQNVQEARIADCIAREVDCAVKEMSLVEKRTLDEVNGDFKKTLESIQQIGDDVEKKIAETPKEDLLQAIDHVAENSVLLLKQRTGRVQLKVQCRTQHISNLLQVAHEALRIAETAIIEADEMRWAIEKELETATADIRETQGTALTKVADVGKRATEQLHFAPGNFAAEATRRAQTVVERLSKRLETSAQKAKQHVYNLAGRAKLEGLNPAAEVKLQAQAQHFSGRINRASINQKDSIVLEAHKLAQRLEQELQNAARRSLQEVQRAAGVAVSRVCSAADEAVAALEAPRGALRALRAGTGEQTEADELARRVERAESSLLQALARPVARPAATQAIGRINAVLAPELFAPLLVAREEGRGEEALGPLDITCLFCFQPYDMEERYPVLAPCCSGRLCNHCARSAAASQPRCCFRFISCRILDAAPTLEQYTRDSELACLWRVARSLGFTFPQAAEASG